MKVSMHSKHFLLYFLIFISNFTQVSCENTTSDHTITVFVHGTTIARTFLQYTPFRPLIYCPQGLSLIKNFQKNITFIKWLKDLLIETNTFTH